MIASGVSPKNPAAPNTLPTKIPIPAPIANLANSNTPPRFNTFGISFTESAVPIQKSCAPSNVFVPALENTAAVSPPISNAFGKIVTIKLPNNSGITIIPAGTFFKKLSIISFSFPKPFYNDFLKNTM